MFQEVIKEIFKCLGFTAKVSYLGRDDIEETDSLMLDGLSPLGLEAGGEAPDLPDLQGPT